MEPYYDHGGFTIYNATCEDFPQTGFDLMLTDPPYGIGEANGKNVSRRKLAVSKDYGAKAWDNEPPPEALLNRLRSQARESIIFGGNYFNLPPSSCWLVWDKDNGATDFADCELAWTNLKKAVRKFKWKWQGMLQEVSGARKEIRQHPTQKPLAVMKWCIRQASEPKTMLDPFMGSGTVLVAAKLSGAKCIGIEIEEEYCEIAANRLAQGVLF